MAVGREHGSDSDDTFPVFRSHGFVFWCFFLPYGVFLQRFCLCKCVFFGESLFCKWEQAERGLFLNEHGEGSRYTCSS